MIDDTVGDLLESQEGFPRAKAEALRKSLLAAARYGMEALPFREKLRMAKCMLRWGMKPEEGYDLYGKYIGNWGGEAIRWRFDAVKNGETVKSATRSMGSRLRLEAAASSPVLRDGDTYDMALIRIRLTDEFGTPAIYAQLPVTLTLTGPAELVGPSVITAEGGSTGTFIRTAGGSGTAKLSITAPGAESASLTFSVE